jgi:hypothetical protein
MLRLPDDWRSSHAGVVITHLFGQASQYGLSREFSGCLIGDCLELAAAGIFTRTETVVVVKMLGEVDWQIGDYTYAYFHETNNESLRRALEMSSRRFCGYIVVPPRHEEILCRACQAVVGNRAPSIIALDTLVNLRALFSLPEFGWSHTRVMIDLLHRYNQKVLDTTRSEVILVVIPPNEFSPS